MNPEYKQAVADRVSALVEVAETVMQQKFGPLDRADFMDSRLFSAIVGNLISSDPTLYDILEEEGS